jgi:hypothetical protein
MPPEVASRKWRHLDDEPTAYMQAHDAHHERENACQDGQDVAHGLIHALRLGEQLVQ